MIFKQLVLGHLMTMNCYIVGCEKTRLAAVIDPGLNAPLILKTLAELELKASKIIVTHGHVDHIEALEEVRQATGATVAIHKLDAPKLLTPELNLSPWMQKEIRCKAAEEIVEDGDIIEVGELQFKVLHTPGHTTGGISLAVENILLTGDSLFAGSIGRSDFPGGSHQQLVQGIKEKLLVYPDFTAVYPGHGKSTSIGEEKAHNPFLN